VFAGELGFQKGEGVGDVGKFFEDGVGGREGVDPGAGVEAVSHPRYRRHRGKA